MYQTSLRGNSSEWCSPTWIQSLINILLFWDVLCAECSDSVSAKPFFVWECFMNCIKEIVIVNHREYKFSIFSVNSRKNWGILTVAWLVLVSTASTQLPFVHFLIKQDKTFMLENILLFKILKLISVGIWGCRILFVCVFVIIVVVCLGFFLKKPGLYN